MARYRTVIDSPRSAEELFSYLADFSNAAEWDPGVVSAERSGSGAVNIGTEFRLVARAFGRDTPMTYRITALDKPRSVTFEAETGTLRSLDTITVSERPAGVTRVTYDADLQLKGLLRVADLPLRAAFGRIGDKARDGLAAQIGGTVVSTG